MGGKGRGRGKGQYLYFGGGLAGRFEVCGEVCCCGGSWGVGRGLASMLCRTALVDGEGNLEIAYLLHWGRVLLMT